jgi:hypothetical protein
LDVVTIYDLMQGYLARLPRAMREEELTSEDASATKVSRWV